MDIEFMNVCIDDILYDTLTKTTICYVMLSSHKCLSNNPIYDYKSLKIVKVKYVVNVCPVCANLSVNKRLC